MFDSVLGGGFEPSGKEREAKAEAAAAQEEAYDVCCRPMVQHVMSGYNACCFAYGQTGSGKTYTMFGHESGDWERRGVTPRVVEEIFAAADKRRAEGVRLTVLASFLEIYLDRTRDLGRAYAPGASAGAAKRQGRPQSARPGGNAGGGARAARPSSASGRRQTADEAEYLQQDLPLLEDSMGNVAVRDLTVVEVESSEQVMRMIEAGLALRQTHSTSLNDISSRSHTVFRLTVVQQRSGSGREATSGQLNLVDLAGSERLKKSESTGQRRLEAQAINKSLTHLGKVVLKLAEAREAQRGGEAVRGGGLEDHVPYRDSKLTRILKNSLGRNSITVLLAALNPTLANYEESLNTLQFAARCSGVQNAPRVNYVNLDEEDIMSGETERMAELQVEVAQLTAALDAADQDIGELHVHYQKILEAVPESYLPSAAKRAPPPSRTETLLRDGGASFSSDVGMDSVDALEQDPVASTKALPRSVSRRLSLSLDTRPAAVAAHRVATSRAPAKPVADEVALRDALREALQRGAEAERAQASEARVAAATLQAARDEAREEVAAAREASAADLARAHEEADALRARVAELSGQVSGMLKSVPDTLSTALQAHGDTAAAAETAVRAAEERYAARLARAEDSKRASVANLKAQAEFFVAQERERAETAKRLAADREKEMQEAQAAVERARTEAGHLERQEADAKAAVAASARLLTALAEGAAALESVGMMPTAASGGPGISGVLTVAAEAARAGLAAGLDAKTAELGAMLRNAANVARGGRPSSALPSSYSVGGGVTSTAGRPCSAPRRMASAAQAGGLGREVSGSTEATLPPDDTMDLFAEEEHRLAAALVKAQADAARYRKEMEGQRRRAHELTIAIKAKDRRIAKLEGPSVLAERGAWNNHSIKR